MASDQYSTNSEWISKIKPNRSIKNIVLKIIRREIFGIAKPCTNFYVTRNFHHNIVPNFTIVNVEKPPCFIRKFSPDGKYFIAFSADQTAVEIYTFKGSAAGGLLLQNCSGEHTGNCSESDSEKIKSAAFSTYFRLQAVVNVTTNGEALNRECSLFTDDGKYVIVGSAVYIPDDLQPSFYDIFTTNEATVPNPRSPLEDYTLHIIDLHYGRLSDSKQFKVDKIYLSHNQGLYLYKDTLAVLSVQHQVVHIFQIAAGSFIENKHIGRFCFEEDDFVVGDPLPPCPIRPFRDFSINSLKHRFLVYLFNENLPDPEKLRTFFRYFDQVRYMKIWKMQLLDENTLLLKYASEDVVTFKASEPNSQLSFFVFYDMASTQVLAVMENTSSEMLYLLENYCDYFRNARSGHYFLTSPSNNFHAKLVQQKFKQTIVSARFGGYTEATKRLLVQLPISAQSFSSSPYLDLSLFSYDDKWVSVMERPKQCGEHPIRFYSRESGSLRFKIYAGLIGNSEPPTGPRRLVAFTFHPSEPFAISIQRTDSDYVLNFHVRLDQH